MTTSQAKQTLKHEQQFSFSRLLAATAAMTLLSFQVKANLSDVNFYNNISYEQTSGAAPSTLNGYFANIGGNFQNVGDFDSVSATYPGPASPVNLTINGTNFNYGSVYDSTIAAQQSDFPYGAYTITANNSVTNVTQSVTINYIADFFTSSLPALTAQSYNALNGLNSNNGYLISFNSFTPNQNVNAGYTFFSIFDAKNNMVFTSGGLSPSATSIFVPANTLLANTGYTYELDFTDRLYSTDPVTGVVYRSGI